MVEKKPSPKLTEYRRGQEFTFGKYKGNTMIWVATQRPRYIVWAYNNVARHGNIPEDLYNKALVQVTKWDAKDTNVLSSEGEEYSEYEMDYDPYAAYGGFFDGTSYGD